MAREDACRPVGCGAAVSENGVSPRSVAGTPQSGIRQLEHEYLWGDRFEYLCVCSDPSVSREVDAWEVRPTDVPFQVDTNPAGVRHFLERPERGKVRVVFSTYQSAPVVARAMRGRAAFNLGIFDERARRQDHIESAFAFAWTISG